MTRNSKGIIAGGEWVYRSPFGPAKLIDDELAAAECLQRMAGFVAGGESFYSLAEASQDVYLDDTVNQSLAADAEVSTEGQSRAS